ncbi:uncharacterized protein [Aegilops tauschii subsp. strangulata]
MTSICMVGVIPGRTSRPTPPLVRNDRVLCTSSWETSFPQCFLSCLASAVSDHCPLLVDCTPQQGGAPRFHFARYWTKLDGFHQTVQEAWNSTPSVDDPFCRIYARLKATARRLQSWSARTTATISNQLAVARELIVRLDMAQDHRPLSPLEAWLRRELKRTYLGLASLERTISRERIRLHWLHEGDTNSAYSKIHAANRRKRNRIRDLLVDGHTISSEPDMAHAAYGHFSSLLGTAMNRDFSINLQAIDQRHFNLSELDRPFFEEEIWRLNEALLILLPRADASSLSDYRPISLIHLIAKLFAKVLSLRLAPRLGELVSVNQSTFIAGRSVHDNFLLVQQTARVLHNIKAPCVLLKLDIARAFDLVSWAFLLDVLNHPGFGHR